MLDNLLENSVLLRTVVGIQGFLSMQHNRAGCRWGAGAPQSCRMIFRQTRVKKGETKHSCRQFGTKVVLEQCKTCMSDISNTSYP